MGTGVIALSMSDRYPTRSFNNAVMELNNFTEKGCRIVTSPDVDGDLPRKAVEL